MSDGGRSTDDLLQDWYRAWTALASEERRLETLMLALNRSPSEVEEQLAKVVALRELSDVVLNRALESQRTSLRSANAHRGAKSRRAA